MNIEIEYDDDWGYVAQVKEKHIVVQADSLEELFKELLISINLEKELS